MGGIGRQAQWFAIAANTQPALPGGTRCATGPEHGRGNIQTDQIGIGIAGCQRGETAAPATAQVENPFGLQGDVIETFLHAAIDFTDEKITLAISRRNAGETSTDLLPVDKT